MSDFAQGGPIDGFVFIEHTCGRVQIIDEHGRPRCVRDCEAGLAPPCGKGEPA